MFFLFGQGGFFIGPIIGGILLTRFGVHGLLLLSALAIPVGINALLQLRHAPNPATPPTSAKMEAKEGATSTKAGRTQAGVARAAPWFIAGLAAVGAFQAWAQQNIITFLPKYLSDLGQPASVYGLFAGLFMAGSALGNVAGGNLADRYGRQRIAVGALALSSLPLFAIAGLGWSPGLYLVVPLAGLLTGGVFSIIVVSAQRVVPVGLATASGLTLGFMFSAGALGTLLCGPLADQYGWPPLFALTAMLVVVAAVITLFLRLDRPPAGSRAEAAVPEALIVERVE
jgi:MFS family permease